MSSCCYFSVAKIRSNHTMKHANKFHHKEQECGQHWFIQNIFTLIRNPDINLIVVYPITTKL
ncbi:hypothetical protein VCHA50O413_10786 [Vibrio chagasii]|nr:hypothetical protein VCHA34P129_110029 [Vibrio chagasii]CAH6830676.1 hypothetical protein VCHA34P114_10129 [Vibrio chagasii]CAH6934049.1 hypothetical protein VCHA52P455_110150 [Vibrio chagasii]CAH6971657.1 hypothetical protein VCHA50P417_150077 [Vibrio chagasii]CAH7000776.1 hypothetical protein VCHA50O409_10787 [Vibrio chagasii]